MDANARYLDTGVKVTSSRRPPPQVLGEAVVAVGRWLRSAPARLRGQPDAGPDATGPRSAESGDGRRGTARQALHVPIWRAMLLAMVVAGAGLVVVGVVLMKPPLGLAERCLLAGAGLILAVVLPPLVIRRKTPPARREAVRPDGHGERLDWGIETLKDLQWQLSDSEARYRDLLDSQTDIIVRYRADGRLTFVNRAFCRTFQVEAAGVLGQCFAFDVIEHEGWPRDRQPEPGRRVRFDQLVATSVGPRWFAFEQHSVPGQTGDVAEIQLIGRDVTEQRRDQAALAEARDQAQAANRAKSRFLAAMSHEIRTPMNGILGMASLISETMLAPEQAAYVAAIDQSAKNLLRIIDEILDLSKIEAGKLEMHPAQFRLDGCAQSVVELLAPRAREKGLDLVWSFAPELPTVAVGDETRVRQILLNLIGNAIKFTDSGGVAIRLRRGEPAQTIGPKAPSHGYERGSDFVAFAVAVDVTDTGTGIAPELLQSLFAEFEQADDVIKRKRSGTGLGLAISRRLARAMGGDIEVVSVPGEGSTFTVRLMLLGQDGERGTRERAAAKALSPVLLVSDRPLQRSVMRETLEATGIPSSSCGPTEALPNIAAAAAGGRPVRVLIVDCEVGTAEIRRLIGAAGGDSNALLRTILVCEQPGRAQLKAFRDAGCDAYLVRPVRPNSLVTQLMGLPDAGAAPPTVASDGVATEGALADQALPARQVLLVEDNDINALLATRMSEKAGCRVNHAASGAQALAYCEAQLKDERGATGIDLVLMDIHMPDMDGFETARRIKRLFTAHGRAAPPIIALTANAYPEDRRRCLDAGLDDYLAKPFERSELEVLLDTWCGVLAPRRDGSFDDRAA